jgi:ferritin-like metal-binding protein YciE
MATLPTFHALLIAEIKDLRHAQLQLLKAMPKMVKAATNRYLKAWLSENLAQARVHLSRLEDTLTILGLPRTGKPCHTRIGLVKEATEVIGVKGLSTVRDAALIRETQRIEHVAGYGPARAYAQALGESKVTALLDENLDEQFDHNKKLTTISLAAGGKIEPVTRPWRNSSK